MFETAQWSSLVALAIVVLTILALAFEVAALEVVMLTGLTALMVAGIVPPQEALAGFSSSAVVTIGALFVVAAGVQQTSLLTALADGLFGRNNRRAPLLRMMVPASVASAFLNNTPIVAMFAPTILEWCRRNRIPPSRMLMPLSFATILGGMCTLIGTSTTLVVDGMMRQAGIPPMGMFEIGAVGLPVAAVSLLVMGHLAPRVLPIRKDPGAVVSEEGREFLVEMIVDPDSPLIGRSIAEVGLRSLSGLYLVAIERDARFMGPVPPEQILRSRDRLVFAGLATTVMELQKFSGLSPAPETHFDALHPQMRRHVFEAVVSRRFPGIGMTIKEVSFRGRYQAAVLAVHRAGQRLAVKLGDVELKPGDTLLLEAAEDFERIWGQSPDFALISRLAEDPPASRRKVTITSAILVGLVASVALGVVPVVVAALGAAVAMVLAGVLTARQARRAVSLQVLIVVACAMGMGKGLEASGAAQTLGGLVSMGASLGPRGVLGATFLLAALLNAAVGNVAAAAMVFPVAMAAAHQVGIEPRPVAFTVALAASCSFLSPTVYPANLIVYGPGGYRYTDFARLGAPVLAVVFLVGMVAIPFIWSL